MLGLLIAIRAALPGVSPCTLQKVVPPHAELEPFVTSIHPVGGTMEGGTPVHICGPSLGAVRYVRFGDQITQNLTAGPRSPTGAVGSLLVVAPPSADKSKSEVRGPLHVSIDGEQWFGGDWRLQFRGYYYSKLRTC